MGSLDTTPPAGSNSVLKIQIPIMNAVTYEHLRGMGQVQHLRKMVIFAGNEDFEV